MNKQKLNEKLAKWAGFRKELRDGRMANIAPNGEWSYYNNFPTDFTQSLDVCFKWLVPQLNSFHYQYSINLQNVRDGWLCQLFESAGNPFNPKRIDVTAKTLALAICLAIEKLIDGKGK